MRRLFIACAAALMTSGCGQAPPDRSVLAEGSTALAFHARSSVVRVDMPEHDGPLGSRYALLETGTPITVQADPGGDSPQRTIWGVPRDGEMKGKQIRIPREWLRPAAH